MADLIERQAAIDAIKTWGLIDGLSEGQAIEILADEEKLPSAQPERILYANMSDAEFEAWLYEHGICNPNIHESIPCSAVPLLIDNAISELPSAQPDKDALDDAYAHGYTAAESEFRKRMDAQPEWIPVKTRPMTDEERNYWSEHYGYDVEYEDAVMFDCKMPEDNQPVWVQSQCGFVYEDVCENDDGMIGLEGNGDWNDIVAWMPKYVPEPWRGENSYTSVKKYKVVYGGGEEHENQLMKITVMNVQDMRMIPT